MTTVAKGQDNGTRTGRQGVVPNIISGLATGLFSIPEGMAWDVTRKWLKQRTAQDQKTANQSVEP